MRLPEYELEKILAEHPNLLKEFRRRRDIILCERQYTIKIKRRRGKPIRKTVDLLFTTRNADKYFIVEVKAIDITSKRIFEKVQNQVVTYRKLLAKALNTQLKKIFAIVVTLGHLNSKLVEEHKRRYIHFTEAPKLDGIKISGLDERLKLKIAAKLYAKRFRRRIKLRTIKSVMEENDINIDDLESYNRIKSILYFIETKQHDQYALRDLANRFKKISREAPTFAHQVKNGDKNTRLKTFEDQWFWLFYTVLDRRQNAELFINARKALEEHDLFNPEKIAKLCETHGKEYAAEKIGRILRENNFPLLIDQRKGELSYPYSIVEAALFLKKFNFDFKRMYRHYIRKNKGDKKKAVINLWKDLQAEIYGVGPRAASQFIRGMVLKGPWKFPLTDKRFLEYCDYNAAYAGPFRLNLAYQERDFKEALKQFADEYLDGNCGIISHVLWYVRKKFCGIKKNCEKCPVAGYCVKYLELLIEKAPGEGNVHQAN